MKQKWSRFLKLWHNYRFLMGVVLVVSAVVLTFFLEFRYFSNDPGRTFLFYGQRPLVFWYSSILMLLMLIFFTGLTRRPIISVGIMLSLIIIATYINETKMLMRGFPLLPEDLLLATELDSMTKMVDMGGVMLTVFGVALALGASIAVTISIEKKFKLKIGRKMETVWWKRYAVLPRLILIVTAMALFLVGTDFVRNNNGKNAEQVPWLATELVGWNQRENYDENGFILGFLYNLQKLRLIAPEGYSEHTILEIRTKYEVLAEEENAHRADAATEEIDFIIMLAETSIDPDMISSFYPYSGEEILPNLHAIKSQYPTGVLYSTDYGGGTANIEFEALTGLTSYWSNTVAYTSLIPKAGQVPSMPSFLKNTGYETTAIHPFNGGMYKRNIVYPELGIDTFITEKEMVWTEREGKGGYISDQSAFHEVSDVLDAGRDSGKNQAVTLITMQNHVPYGDWVYGEGAEMPFKMTGEWPSTNYRKKEMEIYYKLLHSADAYLGEFLGELAQREKKTVLLYFGDHFPGLYPELNENADKELRDLTQQTPYFIYTNYDTGVGAANLAMTTPNCIANTTLNTLKLKKPALFYLLDKVCAETPILTHRYSGDMELLESETIREYELVNYDLLGGGKFWVK